MRLSKPAAVLLLLATLLPLAQLAFFLAVFFSAAFGGLRDAQAERWFNVLFVAQAVCVLWIWALLAFYLVFLFKSNAVPKDQRALWGVALFFANVLVMPVFWYLFVWPAGDRGPFPLCHTHGPGGKVTAGRSTCRPPE
jgi:hypothetical protein